MSDKLSRRTLFGFGAAIVPAVAVHEATLDVLNDPPVPDIDPKIVDTAYRFIDEILPKRRGHFFSDYRNDKLNTAYRWNYSSSGQCFWVTGLERMAEVVNICCVGDQVPTFGVMNKRDWMKCVELMTDLLMKHNPIAAIQARQRRDLKSRYFWWEGIPWFWDQSLTDENLPEWRMHADAYNDAERSFFKSGKAGSWYATNAHEQLSKEMCALPRPNSIYIVNMPSLERLPQAGVTLNGIIENTNSS